MPNSFGSTASYFLASRNGHGSTQLKLTLGMSTIFCTMSGRYGWNVLKNDPEDACVGDLLSNSRCRHQAAELYLAPLTHDVHRAKIPSWLKIANRR